MALDFLCSFEGLVTASLVSGNARFHRVDSGGVGPSVTTSNPRTGSQCLNMGGNQANKRLMSNQATRIIGVGFRYDGGTAFPASDVAFLGLLDGGTVGASAAAAEVQVSLAVTSTGALCAYRGRIGTSGGTKLGSDSASLLVRGGYYFIEFVTTINNSTGIVDVYVDGVSFLSLTSQDTQNTANAFSNGFFLAGTASAITVDDLYVRSGTTTRYGPSFRCIGLLPSGGNGANDQWTKSTGSDASVLLDEVGPNTTDYVSTSTVNHKTTVPMTAVGVTGTVIGTMTHLYASKQDAGVRSIAPVHRVDGTDYDGTTVALAQGFNGFAEIQEVSPDTAAPWTVAELDAMEVGAKLVS